MTETRTVEARTFEARTVQLTELTDGCIDRIADAVAKKVRNMTKPTIEAAETVSDTVERRLRDLCE